jgi:hypothetical protein
MLKLHKTNQDNLADSLQYNFMLVSIPSALSRNAFQTMPNIVGWLVRRRLAPETKDGILKYIADFESSVVLILTARHMIDTNVQNVPSSPKTKTGFRNKRNARVGAFQYK